MRIILLGFKIYLIFSFDYYVKSRFLILIYEFDEEITLKNKSNFIHVKYYYINEIIINIHIKVYLEPFSQLKVIDLKTAERAKYDYFA